MEYILEQLKQARLVDVENRDDDDNTMIHEIMNNENSEKEIIAVLEILLEKDVNSDIKNKKYKTALHLAVENRMKDFLLTLEIDVDSVAHSFIEDEYINFQKLSMESNNFYVCHSEIQRRESDRVCFMKLLISRGFNFDDKNNENQSAIFVAIERNLQHILPALFNFTEDINFVDNRNRTLLHLFLEKKDENCGISNSWYHKRHEVNIVKVLLDRGVSADAEDIYQCTPIRIAIAKKEDLDIVLTLLERSTNVNHKNTEGETLLHMVIRKWAKEEDTDYYGKLAKFLVGKGADVNEPDEHGTTPAFHAIEARNFRIAEFLRENGADFSAFTGDGETLMHFLIKSKNFVKARDEAALQLFELLLEDTSNDHPKNSDGETLFQAVIRVWATSKDGNNDTYKRIASNLIAKGADVNEPDKFGITPAYNAIEVYNVCVVEFLKDNGADFNGVVYGETLIHHVLRSKFFYYKETEIKLLNFLLVDANNVNMTNSKGKTLFYAVTWQWSWSREEKCHYWMNIARSLIAKGADINKPDDCGKTPLGVAVRSYNLPIVEFLRENGADFGATTKLGESLMHFLAYKSGAEVENELCAKLFDVLMSNGGDVNCRTCHGETPLIYMLSNNCNDKTFMTRMLLEHGADINARDIGGFTALHKVAASGLLSRSNKRENLVMLEFLLKHGADFNALTRKGYTAVRMGLWRDYRNNNSTTNVKPHEIPRLELCMQRDISNEVDFLLKHWIKLGVANLKCNIDDDYRYLIEKEGYKSYHAKCSREMETLRNTFIASRTSLYTFLHMDPNSRRAYVDHEKLGQLLHSPKLYEQFPECSALIWSSYHEAVIRRTLFEPAENAWLELTEIDLPEPCIERILSFLSNSDLRDMIGK